MNDFINSLDINQFRADYNGDFQKIQLNEIIFVDSVLKLECINLQNEKLVGVDIEHTKQVGYDGKICLIQLKTLKYIYLIDPIRINDHEIIKNKLKQIFESEDIKKIFYAGTQDCQWLSRDYQIEIQNYCDIKEMAELLNRKTDNSLIGLWKKYCNVDFPKEIKVKLQTSNWYERPLSEEQIYYSAQDCAYLPYIWAKLVEQMIDQCSEEDIQKLQQKFRKPKKYQLEKKSRYQNLLYAISNLEDTLDQFAEYYDSNYYDELDEIEQNIIKFIYTELCEARSQYAFMMNIPQNTLNEDSHLLNAAIVLFQKLQIQNIKQYEQYHPAFINYSNDDYNQTWTKLDKLMTYNDWMSSISNAFMNQLQFNSEFLKWSLTEIYNTELYKSTQKDVQKKKVTQKHQRTIKYNTQNTPVFGDCQLLAPDGMILCNTYSKKAEWYLKHDKAELIQQNPMIIKLKFQPSGFDVINQSNDEEVKVEKQYITTILENQCVVCGAKQNYLKFNIIPPTYKSHFPEKFKSKSIYNQGFVLLCMKCHEKANQSSEVMKEIIAKDFDVPLQTFDEASIFQKKIQQIAKQLKYYETKIKDCPIDVQKRFKSTLRQSFNEIQNYKNYTDYGINQQIQMNKKGNIKIDEQFIQAIHDMQLKIQEKCELKNIHGQLVVNKLQNDNDFLNFINKWKDHFLQSMNPKFLPSSWYVNGKPISQEKLYYEQK